MPVNDRIDVRIIVDGQPAVEYLVPEGGYDDQYIMTRYIEVKTGQRFAVQTRWQAGFNIQFAKHLFTRFSFDDCDIVYTTSSATDQMDHIRGCLMRDEVTYRGTVSHRNKITGVLEDVPPIFSALGISDDKPPSSIALDSVAKLGSIRVTVYRARMVREDKKEINHDLDKFQPVETVPETVMKGRTVKNVVNYGNGTPRYTQGRHPYRYIPVKGKAGAVYQFVFLFRNHEILQHLGIIPRSPSPPPDPALQLSRTNTMLEMMTEQTKKLANRVKELESRDSTANVRGDTPGIKQELDRDGPGLYIKQESTGQGHRAGIKRDFSQVDDDEITEMAPPPKKPKVVVDLTGDD